MLVLTVADGVQTGRSYCEVSTDAPWSAEQAVAIGEAIEAFGDAANTGMLAGARLDPEGSRVVVTSNAGDAGPDNGHWAMSWRSIDAAASRILCELLEAQLAAGDFRVRVTLKPEAAAGSSRGRVIDPQALLYPGHVALPFSLDEDLPDPPPPEVMVRVDFREPLSDDILDDIASMFSCWKRIVELGAFPGSSPVEEGFPVADTYLVSPSLVECAVYGYAGPFEGYEVLLNGLVRVHRTQRAIIGVELE
jgi:hypothetical protein